MILSIIILMFLALGTIIGAKRGFTYQLIKMVGTIIIVILAFISKDVVANFLQNNFDFVNLDKHMSILVYKFISFLLVFFILKLLLLLLLKLSKVFEKMLNATIILGVLSKILGGILGFIEYYIYTFIILLILCLPIFKINITDSKIAKIIVKDTPLISRKINGNLIVELKEKIDLKNFDEKEYEKILKKYEVLK